MSRVAARVDFVPADLLRAALPIVACWCVVAGWLPTASAQEAPAPEATVEEVQARIDTLSGGATTEAQQQLLEAWRKVLTQARARDAQRSVAADFAASRDAAPQRLAEMRLELDAPQIPPPVVPADAPLADLEAELAAAEARLEEARQTAGTIAAERSQRVARRTEIPKLLVAARERLATLATPPAVADTQMAEANRALAAATRATLEAEIHALENERQSYDARAELIAAREDLAARRLAEAQARVTAYQDVVGAGRREAREQAEREAERARRTARDAHPAVRDLAAANAELLRTRNSRAEIRDRDAARLAELQKELEAYSERQERVQSRVERVGYTSAIVSLLRRERALLPDLSAQRKELAARQQRVTEAELALLGLEDDRADLSNLERSVDDLLALHPVADEAERAAVRAAVLELLEDRRTLLDETISTTGAWFDQLVDLDSAQRQLIDTVEDYRLFIDERILWVRSTDLVGPRLLVDTAEALAWLLDPRTWQDLPAALADPFRGRPASFALSLTLLAVLGLLRPWMRRRVRTLGRHVREVRISAFSDTVRTLVLTLLLAAFWPLALVLLARAIPSDADTLPQAVSGVLSTLGAMLAPVTLLHAVCIGEGLGEVHLRWPEAATRQTRRALKLFSSLALPALAVALLLDQLDAEARATSLGRLLMVVAYGLLAVLVVRLLGPSGAVRSHLELQAPRGWLTRLYPVWFGLALGLPLVLVVALLLGYQYTATRLGLEVLTTWTLAFSLVLVHGLFMRWLAMEKRKARLDLARRRREEAERVAEESGAAASGSAITSVPPEDPDLHLDLDAVDTQARGLLRAMVVSALILGLWLIWADILPAFGALRRVTLWNTTVEAPSPEGPPTEVLMPVSLADLLFALVIFGLSFSAARNIPGFLDVALFRRLPMLPSTGYALSTVLRYTLSTVGVVLGFSAIGVGWNKVQWLIAAMGLGLGFGLQEIFGNFVCGLILLFERRIRVDDIVTVGEISGKVLRIRVLATTIRDWDRKEFVVPNKELITGRLLNWTLSDQVNRVTVTVGVAYGSDTPRARALLLEVADGHDAVLAEPEPIATFEAFGDSTLTVVLRCFLPNLDNRLKVITDLHERIDAAFKAAGIEIAFPQRDLHLRSADALLRIGAPGPAGPSPTAGGGAPTPPAGDVHAPPAASASRAATTTDGPGDAGDGA